MFTVVTTEHQDINQSRRFLNQPSIAPFNTSSIINQIRMKTQPNLAHRRFTFHNQRSVPVHPNPGGYLPSMEQGSTKSVNASTSHIRSQTKFSSNEKTKGIQPNPAKTT
jgi:hypothetical protein